MNAKLALALIGLALFLGYRYFFSGEKFEIPKTFPTVDPREAGVEDDPAPAGTELATFGSGCFWCTEAVFQDLKGVESVTSGYSGGKVINPSYEAICTGRTGHAEVVQIRFDPKVISYAELLEVFWRSHDPTTLNRQGMDHGTQYRSVIFHHSDRQRKLAEFYLRKIDEAGVYPSPLVTQVVPFEAFYPAEEYHQDFFSANPRQPYCRNVIAPKMEKLREIFRDKLAGR